MSCNVVKIFQITYATSREQKLNNKLIAMMLSTGIKLKITEYAFKPEHISSHFLLTTAGLSMQHGDARENGLRGLGNKLNF